MTGSQSAPSQPPATAGTAKWWALGIAGVCLLLLGVCVGGGYLGYSRLKPRLATLARPDSDALESWNERPPEPTTLKDKAVFPTQRPMRYLSQWQVRDFEAAQMFRRREYGQLEALARELRAERTRDREGLPRLGEFYEAVALPYTVSELGFRMFFERLNEWEQAFPESVTVKTALAKAWLNYADYGRGYGWPASVSDEEGRVCREREAKANAYVEQARRLPEHCPELDSVRLELALGEIPAEAHEALFREAIARDPEYEAYYADRAWALLPLWYGQTPNDWERFLAAEADRIGGVQGDVLYARVASYIFPYEPGIFYDRVVSWERMQRGWEEILRQYPTDWHHEAYCLLACNAGDRETAKRLFPKPGNIYWLSLWNTDDYIHECQAWVNGTRDEAPPWPGEPTW